jgi:hypothetical protein
MAVTTHLAVELAGAPRPGEAGYDPFLDLWSRLARPFEAARTVSALVGLPERDVDRLVGVAVATSPEAERLLDELPTGIRSLATNMKTHAERCVGELRGPVLWSETIAARASSFGQDDVYVCSTPARAYDIDENQVLVAALEVVKDAADRATDGVSAHTDDPVLRAARRNGLDAGRFSNHPTLARVSRTRPNLRQLKRARTGKKRATYEPALDALDRAQNPLGVEDVRVLCDERTRAQHAVLMRAVHRLEALGGRMPEFRVVQHVLSAGPIHYHHPRRLGERRRLSGILVGDVLIDVPDRLHDPDRKRNETSLATRARGRTTFVVMTEEDVDRAVEHAVAGVRHS